MEILSKYRAEITSSIMKMRELPDAQGAEEADAGKMAV